MKVHIVTYGCSANKSNSEIMAALLKNAGHEITTEAMAELVIVNSCTVKKPTEHKVITKLRDLQTLKKKILVSGCMPEVQEEMLEEMFPEASMMGINAVTEVADVVNKIEQGYKLKRMPPMPKSLASKPKLRINPAVNIIQVSQGCNWNCHYCVVRSAKGSLFSYPIEDIIKDIKQGINDGCKEIRLTSQDMANYGIDWDVKLPVLLRKICTITGDDFKIRIGMMNPASVLPILDDLVNSYHSQKIYKFLHLPVQSGSDEVLRKMNRRYTIEEFKIIYDKFKESFPEITFATDIIVGYPGETDEDFDKTMELVKGIQPDIVNISRFCPRPLTMAARLEQIPGHIVKERSKKLSMLAETINLQQNKKWVGWIGEALVSEEDSTSGCMARNFAYKPILLQDAKLGEKVKVEVTKARYGYLVGHVV